LKVKAWQPWVAASQSAYFSSAHSSLQTGFGKGLSFIRKGSIPFVTQIHTPLKVPCVLIAFATSRRKCTRPYEHRAWKLFTRHQSYRPIFNEDLAGL